MQIIKRCLINTTSQGGLWQIRITAKKTKIMIKSRRSCVTLGPELLMDEEVIEGKDRLDVLVVSFNSLMTTKRHVQSLVRTDARKIETFRILSNLESKSCQTL